MTEREYAVLRYDTIPHGDRGVLARVTDGDYRQALVTAQGTAERMGRPDYDCLMCSQSMADAIYGDASGTRGPLLHDPRLSKPELYWRNWCVVVVDDLDDGVAYVTRLFLPDRGCIEVLISER